MTKEDFTAALIAQTELLKSNNNSKPCENLTPFQKEVQEGYRKVPGDCSGNGERVYKEEARKRAKEKGEVLPDCLFGDDDDELEYVPFAVVVPLDNPNSHNYRIGEPVLLVLDEDGDMYNLPTIEVRRHNNYPHWASSSRAATVAEIKQLVESLDIARFPEAKAYIPQKMPLEKAPLEKVPGPSKKHSKV